MRLALAVIFIPTIAVTADSAKRVRQYLPHREVRNYGEPSQLLGSSDDLVLLLVSAYKWISSNWWCMKSRLNCMEATNKTFYRTDYYWIPEQKTSNRTVPRKPGNLTFQYDIIRKEKNYTTINTTLITESKNYSYGEYPVHYADEKCMVIAFPKEATYLYRRPVCALWVLNTTLGSPEHYRHCVYILLAVCRAPIYNAYEYEKANCTAWGEPAEAKRVHIPTLE
uniref:Lipocalin n=1 Tax=Rhipicephalus pulchellus TaxID=72859 RepID=L7LYM4_RHIPC